MTMASKPTLFEKEQAYREAFLAHLNQKLAAPTTEWPTVRYWTKPALDKVFKRIREELAEEEVTSGLSHSSLLEWLCRLRLATSIPVEGGGIYLLEIGAGAEADVDPWELLMAGKPSGIICYFSAVAFHALTTQVVEHHHIADLQLPSSGSKKKRSVNDNAEQPESPKPSEKPVCRDLGTLLFRYRGISFYRTRRFPRMIPGIQMRGYGPRSQIRITTLEQTLLDCLYKPFHCGGPEVVFEAWQEAITSRRINEDRLLAYLRAMNYPATTRRLAVIWELVGGTPSAELQRFLQASQEAIDRKGPHARISLLPGVDYQSLNETWLVNTP